ncbi:hypothetical protein [Trinickia sp. EG282A]|uniref:hypothetical protein n=1 Tax=Trinickia sp. EG282A TaxID=3237013 RepID=UPI0034D26B05
MNAISREDLPPVASAKESEAAVGGEVASSGRAAAGRATKQNLSPFGAYRFG